MVLAYKDHQNDLMLPMKMSKRMNEGKECKKLNILFQGQIISATFECKCGSKAAASVAE